MHLAPGLLQVLALVASLALGFLLGWGGARFRTSRRLILVKAHLDERDRRVAELGLALAEARRQLDAARDETRDLRVTAARLEERRAADLRAADERMALVERSEARLRDTFAAVSGQALRQNSQEFLDLAGRSLAQHQERATSELAGREQAIAHIVRPLEETLARMETRLGEVERERLATASAFGEQLRQMVVAERRLEQETARLARSLRVPSVTGRWGEAQLRRVVEMAGMTAACDFIEQASTRTDDGIVRPDLVVRLPGGRQVVVDAKAPLKAYLEAIDTDDEEARRNCLAEHARQVRAHVIALAAKSYWAHFDPTPDMVVLFLPGEAFFSAALQADPGLLEFAAERRVIPASPTTLVALLRAIACGWRQVAIADNAREISELGRVLHERLVIFARHLDGAGRGLERAVDGYNAAVGSLEGRVLSAARRFKELGAAAGDDVPEVTPVARGTRRLASLEGD